MPARELNVRQREIRDELLLYGHTRPAPDRELGRSLRRRAVDELGALAAPLDPSVWVSVDKHRLSQAHTCTGLLRARSTEEFGWSVANVRGNLYSVSDFSAFLGAEAVKLSADARLLVLSERFRCGAALLVERSLGLRALGELTPQSVAAPTPWIRGQYSDAEGRIWKELDVAALVQHEAFLEVSS